MATDLSATFGRYQLLGVLGRGGFATVYRAHDPLLQRDVALKTLLPHLAEEREVRDRFIAESQRIAQLHHPNIITVYDVGEAEGRPFFTMELIEGYTLNRLMSDGGQPLTRVAGMMQGLCSAVDYLHQHHLVHRDIKPANIMIDAESGRVVLMDFGVARVIDQKQFTQTGISIGTPTAMAPEQVRGKPAGPAADIYSLGVLTYQLLTGKPPFSGDTAYILYAHAHESPPPLRELVEGLPETAYEAVDSALAKSPERRPRQASDLAAALAGTPLPGMQQNDPTIAGFTARTNSGTHGVSVQPPVTPRTGTAQVQPEAPVFVQRTPAATASRRRPPALLAVVGGAVLLSVIAGVAVFATRGSGKKAVTPSAVAGVPSATVAETVVAPPPASATVPPATPTTAATNTPAATATATAVPATPPSLASRFAVTTLAGAHGGGYADGPFASAQFNAPSGLAIDGAGKIYVADFDNQRVRVIGVDGNVSTLAGNGNVGFADGPGQQALFAGPSGLALDAAGNVYVADRDNQRIRKITPNGTVSTVAGTGERGFADGPGSRAKFSQPGALAVDRAGAIYVADFDNQRIRKIDTAGNVTTFAGSGAKGYADGPGPQAQFSSPSAITVDSSGSLFVVDFDSPRVRKITPDGTVSTVTGSGDKGNADGPPSKAQFARPGGLTVDRAGNVYIADTGNNRIRLVLPDGTVSTIAGTGAPGSEDGDGTSAQFDGPSDVAIDGAGNIYIADIENSLIRKITRTGG
jgi:serine/threonine-protein kinase